MPGTGVPNGRKTIMDANVENIRRACETAARKAMGEPGHKGTMAQPPEWIEPLEGRTLAIYRVRVAEGEARALEIQSCWTELMFAGGRLREAMRHAVAEFRGPAPRPTARAAA